MASPFPIPLNAIRAIEIVARRGALAPAAEELGVTPGAVSQQASSLANQSAGGINEPSDWQALRQHPFAGLGYHSPNMELSQKVRLVRAATGYDQESIATLILSGQFLGFLPDHYAQSFVRAGQMRAIQPALFRYDCRFFAITRRSPQPARATRAFQDCLAQARATTQRPA